MTKIKIIAIAKDEAAYLPEWVFHHLYFGFDELEIHLNRCSDNSQAMANVLSELYPNVKFKSGDWVDYAPQAVGRVMQYAIYAQAYEQTQTETDFTHVMFLDIDEFWWPANASDNIHHCLSQFNDVATVSFPWLNELGQTERFGHLSQEIDVDRSPTVKSSINIKAKLKSVALHLSEIDDSSPVKGHVLCDGNEFNHSPRERQRLAGKPLVKDLPYFTLHRMYRSADEYLSLLNRGNPRGNTPFKLNRTGFITETTPKAKVIFPKEAFETYVKARDAFFGNSLIQSELTQAQAFIVSKKDIAIKLLQKGPDHYDKEHFQGIKRIFSGTGNAEVEKALIPFKKAPPTVPNKSQIKSVVKRLLGRQ